KGLQSSDELNTYFVGDSMVAKVREISTQLRDIGDSVKAEELDSRLKSSKEDAARALRDRQDIFEEGTSVIKLGRHRFSVNEQPFDLTMVPYEDGMGFHLTGTDFHEMVADEEFEATREYWDQLVISETNEVYRGEYLAASVLFDAEEEKGGLRLPALHEAAVAEGGLLELVRKYAAERYEEGYERGLHDHDAALILERLLALYETADLLRFAPRPRACAGLFWAFYGEQMTRALWERRAHSLARLRSSFAHSPAIGELQDELGEAIGEFFTEHRIEIHSDDARLAGAYLFEELAKHPLRFTTSAEAVELRERFQNHLRDAGTQRDFTSDLEELQDNFTNRHQLATAWVRAFLEQSSDDGIRKLAPSLDETVALLLTERRLDRAGSSALASLTVEGLLGQHPRISSRQMELRLDEFLSRLTAFRQHRVPGFRNFQEMRHKLLERERKRLRLTEYMPKVMSAFVRNRLINEVYLPLIGDNLAKQLGALGAGKRTDQMGLLLLISPPGYGKTTLMEYVTNRLGLVFVKVNGPALGHTVTSIDPSEAPNATARQEVEKINFALEMANNVLLYLDDIQHTNSELLQKFISLCDAQRRIEGVWHGQTSTYDLRGKRFAICMAGNPYTESGDKFQIPDMLANRADTYNLGDILEGKDDVFALSYLENSLTSNPVLAPLSTRDPKDFHLLVRMAQGEEIQADQLSYGYSQVELEEMLGVLRKLLRIQQVVLSINLQYIESAAQDDAFRTEPRFQLQGSYRNMNKMAEKVAAVMNEKELEALIDNHYVGEAQTLTTGAEHNLLKLGELRGTMNEEQVKRWDEIKRGFARKQVMGGDDEDPAVKVIGQLSLLSDRLQDIGRAVETATTPKDDGDVDLGETLRPYLETLQGNLSALQESSSGDGEGASAAVAAGISAGIDKLAQHMRELTQTLATQAASAEAAPPPPPPAVDVPPPPPAPAAPSTDLSPYLDKLSDTMKALAEAPRGTEVVQSLDPGVYDILDQMSAKVADQLLPLVQGISRRLKTTALAQDRGA
ncbi:MAG: ATP-binding protein, partial [bacterium]|nr:ATP-binding protein [bacterium]